MTRRNRCLLGLVGCGRWGRHILRDLLELGCEVWVVARDESSKNSARQSGAAHIVASIAELPDGLEGYVVATPTSTHFEVIESLAWRGKPIYCEKPLTNDVLQAEIIVQHWGDLVFVMDKWRYHPAIEQMRLWAQSGRFGGLHSIRTRRMQWGSPHADVGAPWVLMPHDLSILRHIIGKLPTILWCCGQEQEGEIYSITTHLSGSVDCLLEVSTRSPITHRRVEFYAENGAAILEDADYGHLLWNHQGAAAFACPPEKYELSASPPLAVELAAFVDYVHRGGAAPLTSAAEGLESVIYIAKMIDMVRCRSSL